MRPSSLSAMRVNTGLKLRYPGWMFLLYAWKVPTVGQGEHQLAVAPRKGMRGSWM